MTYFKYLIRKPLLYIILAVFIGLIVSSFIYPEAHFGTLFTTVFTSLMYGVVLSGVIGYCVNVKQEFEKIHD